MVYEFNAEVEASQFINLQKHLTDLQYKTNLDTNRWLVGRVHLLGSVRPTSKFRTEGRFTVENNDNNRESSSAFRPVAQLKNKTIWF